MDARHYSTYSAARANLRHILDTALTGRVTTVRRGTERFVFVRADDLRTQLEALRPARAVIAAEGGGWSVCLPNVPITGEALDLNGAIEDLIDALRDYAADWNERLFDAANHRDNWSLVALTELSDDAQLRSWLVQPA